MMVAFFLSYLAPQTLSYVFVTLTCIHKYLMCKSDYTILKILLHTLTITNLYSIRHDRSLLATLLLQC